MGKGSGLGVGKSMSGLKKRKTTHHLGRASSRGRPRGTGGEGQSSCARPAGLAAPGQGPREAAWSRASASRRGPAPPGAGVTDGGRVRGAGWAAAGARPGEAPREPDSRVGLHCCCSRGKGEQNSFRSSGSRALEPFQAGPERGGNGRAVGAGSGRRGGEASLHGVLLCFL